MQLELMKLNRMYPCEYMNGFETFDETKLPETEDLYSALNNKDWGDRVVKIMMMLWMFGINFKWRNGAILPMGHYHDLNLKTDILLLADIFKELRNVCIEYN